MNANGVNPTGINAVNNVNNVNGVSKKNAVKAPERGARIENAEGFSISPAAKEFHAVRQAVAHMPEARMYLVDEIKAQIEEGRYKTSVNAVAEKLNNTGFFF